MQPTYRQWLQSLANIGGGGVPQKEANALLQVVGDDFGINKNFLADPYKYTNSEYGQVGAGYGPQGISRINDLYTQKYNAKYGGGGSAAPTDGRGSGGGGSGRTYDPLNQGAVDATNASIAGLDTILANALLSAQTGYDNARNLMNEQEGSQRKSYDEGTLSNMQNYDANLGASLRAGRSGLSGLMAALRGGGGAGNDFARNWVQNTVADTASNDIREGYNTFDENKRGLDSSLSTFLTDLGRKRQENEDTLANNRRAANLYDAQQRQSLNQTLSDLYGKAGMFGQASDFMGRAGGQAGRIAENSGAKVSAYNTAPVEVKAPDITAFASPEKQAMTASPDRTSSGIFSILDPRRRERETVGA